MKFRLPGVLIPVFLLLSGVLAADEAPLPLAQDFTSRIGWTPEEAFSELGAPVNIFTYRGATPEEDNAVFFYPDRSYLFWFQDRVWQVRVDSLWEGDIDGVTMGMSLEEVIAAWGRNPINMSEAAPTWTLPDRGYPVRIRLYFNEHGRVSDIYVFRSDW